MSNCVPIDLEKEALMLHRDLLKLEKDLVDVEFLLNIMIENARERSCQ